MKKTLAILLALVLCLSAFAMIACNDCDHVYDENGQCTKCGAKDPNYKPGGNTGDDADVPVAEGKVTFYFTLGDDSLAIPSYASPFFTGGQLGFATGTDAIEFTRLGDSKVYYVQIEYDATKTQANDYQIVLGYNASSELPADKLGLKWVDAYKSDECAGVSYPDNPQFTYTAGATKINLGSHKFSTEVAKPERINTTFAVTFLPALPETAEVYLIGTMNEWNTSDLTKSKMTADAAREVYSIAMTDVLCSTHYYKLLVFLDGTANVVKPLDKDGNPQDIWNWQKPAASAPEAPAAEGDGEDEPTAPAEKKYLAYIEISAGDDNLPIDVAKRHGGSTVELAGTHRKDQLDKDGVTVITPKTGLDLAVTNLTEVEGEQDKLDAEGNPVKDEDGNVVKEPNGIIATKYILVPTKTLTVEFSDALPDEARVYVIGSFLSSDWATTVGQARMTISEDRKSATVDYKLLPGDYEFNVIVIHKDIELPADDSSTVQAIWDYGTALSRDKDGKNTNAKISVKDFTDGAVALFGEKQDVPEVKPPVKATNVVLTVTFDAAIAEGKHVLVAGNFEGWKGTAMTPNADRTVWTLTLPEMIVKTYECQVGVSNDPTKMVWDMYGKNKAFTVEESTKALNIFGEEVLKAPAAEVEVTLTVTFSGMDLTNKYVGIKGGMNGWVFVEMQTEDHLTYTLTINAIPGQHEFIIGIGDDATSAGNCAIKVAGDGAVGDKLPNAKVTIEAAGTVNLFAATVDLSTAA